MALHPRVTRPGNVGAPATTLRRTARRNLHTIPADRTFARSPPSL
jgi:hypothetical protein